MACKLFELSKKYLTLMTFQLLGVKYRVHIHAITYRVLGDLDIPHPETKLLHTSSQKRKSRARYLQSSGGALGTRGGPVAFGKLSPS